MYLFTNTSTPSSTNSITWNESSFNVPGGISLSSGNALTLVPTSFPSKTYRIYSPDINFNVSINLPTYSIDTIGDSLVGAAATQTLTNKTMGSLKVGSNGTTVSNMTFVNFTTGAPGANYPTFTINHNLGEIPTFASAIVNKTGFSTNDSFLVMVNSWTSTQITFMITRTDANIGRGNSYTVNWMEWN